MKSLTAQSAIYCSMYNPRELGGAITLTFDGKSEYFPFEIKFSADESVGFFLYRNGSPFFCDSDPDHLFHFPPLTSGEEWLAITMMILAYKHACYFNDFGLEITPEIDVMPEDPEILAQVLSVLDAEQRTEKSEN